MRKVEIMVWVVVALVVATAAFMYTTPIIESYTAWQHQRGTEMLPQEHISESECVPPSCYWSK